MQLQYFLLGGLAYHGYRYLRDWSVPHAVKRASAIGVWIFAFVMIYRGYAILQDNPNSRQLRLLLVFAATLPFVFYLTRNWRWDNRVGDYSYPIYVFHYTVSIGVSPWWTEGKRRGVYTLLSPSPSARVFLYVVDRPLQRLRRRIASRAGVKGPTVLNAPEPSPSLQRPRQRDGVLHRAVDEHRRARQAGAHRRVQEARGSSPRSGSKSQQPRHRLADLA